MIEGIIKLKIGILICIVLLLVNTFVPTTYTLFEISIALASVPLTIVLLCGIFYKLWKYKRLQRNIMSSLAEEAIAKEGILGSEKNV